MIKGLKKAVVRYIRKIFLVVLPEIDNIFQIELERRISDANLSSQNPLNKRSHKCFSQNDEDGITIEIIRRLGISGSFIEFGVGDGLECNTLVLRALGWKGMWVGDERLAISSKSSASFLYIRERVCLENLAQILESGYSHFGQRCFDVASVDLDGNDYYFVEKLLELNLRPKLFIVEYNGKFLPPIHFIIEYDPDFIWSGDDYFGASLQAFVSLFDKFGYTLVCCNASTGSNAFFVLDSEMERFSDIPSDIQAIYVSPSYFEQKRGHPKSVRVVESVIEGWSTNFG